MHVAETLDVSLSDRHMWSTLSLYKVDAAKVLPCLEFSPHQCRDHLEMTTYLWIQKCVLLLSFLSPPVISTISTCPTKDPVVMVLKSSNESLGATQSLDTHWTNHSAVLESPGYPDFNSMHACTWRIQPLHGGRVKVTSFWNWSVWSLHILIHRLLFFRLS